MANHIGDLTHYGDHKTADSGIILCESQIATSIGDETLLESDDNHRLWTTTSWEEDAPSDCETTVHCGQWQAL